MGTFLASLGWHVMDFFISEAASQGIEPEEPPLNRDRRLASRGRKRRTNLGRNGRRLVGE